MNDNLVKRLREQKDYKVVGFTPVTTTVPLCAEAADRIEELERKLERIRIECEFICDVTGEPLINPLETGFRHSPLTQRERETRYMEACALAYQSASAALKERSND